MKKKKATAVICAGIMLLSALTGCGSRAAGGNAGNTGSAGTESTPAQSSAVQQESGAQAEGELPDVEVWTTNEGYLAVEKDSAEYNFYKELIGVGLVMPYVEWNGGTTYQEQLNLRIAAGEMPDVFIPVNGMETDLIKSGALLDLTDLLPEYAPNLWNLIPEELWDAMRAMDPSGEGKIYCIPQVIDYGRNGGMIRKDWLDALHLEMPATQEEFVEVLRAFKTQDPNGNGMADELPTGGRAEARWMGQLFGMYGVAMWEGFPQWDIYDGELTYAGVTSNMRDALEWIHSLYAEGLIDPETLLNDKAAWDGKINSDKVGIWEHIPQESYSYAENIASATGKQPEIAILPAISAPGYEGFYTARRLNGINFVVANTDDEAKIQAVMKFLNAYADTSLWSQMYTGVEGMHSEMVDGSLKRLPDDKATQQKLIMEPWNGVATVDFQLELLEGQMTADREWAIFQSMTNIQENQKYVKAFAGDGIPSSIFSDYPDINNRTLYIEYATKIITGEYPIEKFDEFVEKWYATGGEQVTELAREWYASTQK